MNILLITHSRVVGVVRLIESILDSNPDSHIYISIDGAQNDFVKRNQLEMKRYFDMCISRGVRLHYRFLEINYGVGAGVINAVDWFYNQVEFGVVLEDDLIVSNDFFAFCSQALEIFKNDEEVWMISGSQILGSRYSADELNFANYPMIWGWATWRDKWLEMRKYLVQVKKIPVAKLFDRKYLFWAIGANRALNGLVDTWDTPLAFEFITREKICVISPTNLVTNVGDDNSAAHTQGPGFPLYIPIGIYQGFAVAYPENRKTRISAYNAELERILFKIRFHHLFIPYYSRVLDRISFPRESRTVRLIDRLSLD